MYKLIGPTLIKQDLVEAKANVRKRLEFIEGELTRSDSQLKSMEAKMTEQQREVKGGPFVTNFNSRLIVVCGIE